MRKQLQKLMKKVCQNPHKNKLTEDMYDYHRNNVWPNNKASLIAEQEIQTGLKWPLYSPNYAKISGNGNRKNGRTYDAHKIIPNVYDSSIEWWNIFPSADGSEHQGGIHGSGAPFYDIFPNQS